MIPVTQASDQRLCAGEVSWQAAEKSPEAARSVRARVDSCRKARKRTPAFEPCGMPWMISKPNPEFICSLLSQIWDGISGGGWLLLFQQGQRQLNGVRLGLQVPEFLE